MINNNGQYQHLTFDEPAVGGGALRQYVSEGGRLVREHVDGSGEVLDERDATPQHKVPGQHPDLDAQAFHDALREQAAKTVQERYPEGSLALTVARIAMEGKVVKAPAKDEAAQEVKLLSFLFDGMTEESRSDLLDKALELFFKVKTK